MKILSVAILSTIVLGCAAQDAFDTNYKYTVEVFMRNLDPYLVNFAKAQYPPLPDSKEHQLLEQSLVRVFKQNAEMINRDCYTEMLKLSDQGMKFDNNQIKLTLEKAYRYGFPGLDYKYFEKVDKEIKSKLGD